jgi:hypothetical protein
MELFGYIEGDDVKAIKDFFKSSSKKAINKAVRLNKNEQGEPYGMARGIPLAT